MKKQKIKRKVKEKFIKLTIGKNTFKISSLIWESLKPLLLNQSQLARTLDLIETSGVPARQPQKMEIEEREWFLCPAYLERVLPEVCVRRILLKPMIYHKCRECSLGRGYLTTCIGYGFNENSQYCLKCPTNLACRSIVSKSVSLVNQQKQKLHLKSKKRYER